MELVPNQYIDYNGHVLVLEEGDTPVKIQYKGVACYQWEGDVKLVKAWKSDSRIFNADFWYSATNWCPVPTKIYFTGINTEVDKKAREILDGFFNENSDFDKVNEEFKKLLPTIEANSISKSMLRHEIAEELKKQGFNPTDILLNEALTMFQSDGKEYILTWNNCD